MSSAAVADVKAIGMNRPRQPMTGIQLSLLTVALDFYLGANGGEVWQMALLSGAIFSGGLAKITLPSGPAGVS